MVLPGPAGIAFLLVFGLLVPVAAFRSRRHLELLGDLPRLTYLRNVVFQQVIFGAFALVVWWTEYIPVAVGRLDAVAALVALAILAAAVLLARPYWARKVAEGDRRLALFVPRTARERSWWVAVSLAAGISEEFVWRGVMVALLWGLFGGWLAAAVVTSLLFGAAHAIQGAVSAIIIAAGAMVLAWLVHWTGGLLLAMAVHAAYDVVAGFSYARMLEAHEAATPAPAN
jgi:membrane protease YdiL (CAAX protease family)